MTTTPERRCGDRVNTCIVARILDQTGRKIQVLVVDLSISGARLEVRSSASLPKRFRLVFAQDGREFDAELVWRADGHAGVHFIDSDARPAPPPAAPERTSPTRPSPGDLRKIFRVGGR